MFKTIPPHTLKYHRHSFNCFSPWLARSLPDPRSAKRNGNRLKIHPPPPLDRLMNERTLHATPVALLESSRERFSLARNSLDLDFPTEKEGGRERKSQRLIGRRVPHPLSLQFKGISLFLPLWPRFEGEEVAR